jgi:signal transduction histidine kinase/ligand-binding sensor domain-containing protein
MRPQVIHCRTVRAGLSRHVRVLLLLLASLLSHTPAHAQAEASRFGAFRHDRWMNYEGAPTVVNAMAQTPDGWIWLAAAEGLFRFDGLTFEQISGPVGSPIEHANAWSLLVTKSGELWVGFGQPGGVAVYRHGRLEEVPMPQRPTSVRSLAQTADGAIWASTDPADSPRLRLFRWAAGRWDQKADAHLGLGAGIIWGLCATGDGSLWVSLLDYPRLWFSRLRAGGRSFEITPYRDTETYRCHVDAKGQLWFLNKPGMRLSAIIDGKERVPAPDLTAAIKSRISRIGFDSAGGFWASTSADGLYYLPGASNASRITRAETQHFTAADGLSSDVLWGMFVDRQDNVWLGSELGFDRFRRSSVIQQPSLPIAPIASWGMSQARDGIYVDTNYGVYRVAPGPLRRISNAEPGGQCPARANGIWIIYPDKRIVHVDGGEKEAFPVPPNVTLTSACAEDRLGRLWVGTFDGELRWHDDRGWHTPGRAVPKVFLWDLVPTQSGDIAYMTPTDLVRLIGTKFVVTPLARWKPGTLTSLSAGTRDLFVSGSDALLRIRDGHVARIDWRRFPWIAKLRGLVQTPRGETWLMTNQFISRVKTTDLDRAFDDPSAPLERTFFDQRDGMGQAQNATYRGPQVTTSADGKIWQVNRYGVSYIDAPKLSPDVRAPPIVLRWLSSAGKSYRDPTSLVLPPGTRAFDIAYTTLSYAYPERVRFRYRLEGIDEDWVDAGSRRLASYTNLGAGHYRFHVIVSENQSVWTNPGATLDVEIKPTFIQSWPFKLLCTAAVLGLLWLAYSLRLRAVASHIRMRMSERVAERERIARDLHDTLLQSVQALTLRMQLAVDDMPEKAGARPGLEKAIDQAEQVIAEGRDRVRDLRPPTESAPVERVISDLVARQTFDPAVVISIATYGAPRELDPPVLDEVTRIAGEAIFNIWRHAGAGRVTIEIKYEASFRLRLADDGRGINPEILQDGVKSGHFGLSGMRERAHALRGDLSIACPPDGGTEVVLTIPGAIAYRAGDRRAFYRLGKSAG